MFEFTLKIDSAVAELLGLDGDSIIEAFYDPDEGEIVIRVLDEDELDGEFNAPPLQWLSAVLPGTRNLPCQNYFGVRTIYG